MLVNCPHCEAGLDVASEHHGQAVQCPACNGKFKCPEGSTQVETTAGGKEIPERKGWVEKDHANPNFLVTLGIGLGITVVFLAMLYPLKNTTIGAIFVDRGWVNWAETFLFFWGMVVLVLKTQMNKRQEKAAVINLFPEHLGKEVTANNVGAFIDNIYKVPLTLRDSLIVNRIRKALELFEIRNDNNEVAAFMQTQSEIDGARSDGSYSLLKIFLWAIPILGFIGTVMGLSTAVGSLALDPSNPDAMADSLASLTGGLGTAFDTTLLGLFLSLLLNFPLAMVQKKEDETLTIIEIFCTEKLLPKLNDSKGSSNDEILQQADSLPELVGSLSRAHSQFLDNLNASTLQLRETSELLNNRLSQSQQTVEANFTEAVEKLSNTSTDIFLKADSELNSTFKRLATGVDLINGSLKKLGEQQIEGGTKKKGLFGR